MNWLKIVWWMVFAAMCFFWLDVIKALLLRDWQMALAFFVPAVLALASLNIIFAIMKKKGVE